MIKFKVIGDSSANKFYSSSIIIDRLNEGAKKVGLYDENGKIVYYSTTANTNGERCDAILCVYETSFPNPIIQNARGRPLIGCSLHNLFFVDDIYPLNISAYCQLGVDSERFKPIPVRKDKFRFLAFCESNVRSGLDVVLQAFCDSFPNGEAQLYIKDRGATEKFKAHVQSFKRNSDIIHDTENTESFDNVVKLYNSADYLVATARSSTWCMPVLEGMSCGVPAITVNYTGPSEYVKDDFNGLIVKHRLELMNQTHINSMVKDFGYRHHMFSTSQHLVPPYWAEPCLDDLSRIMSQVVDSHDKYPYLSRNARATAEQFTWERGAATLSTALYKIFKQ